MEQCLYRNQILDFLKMQIVLSKILWITFKAKKLIHSYITFTTSGWKTIISTQFIINNTVISK